MAPGAAGRSGPPGEGRALLSRLALDPEQYSCIDGSLRDILAGQDLNDAELSELSYGGTALLYLMGQDICTLCGAKEDKTAQRIGTPSQKMSREDGRGRTPSRRGQRNKRISKGPADQSAGPSMRYCFFLLLHLLRKRSLLMMARVWVPVPMGPASSKADTRKSTILPLADTAVISASAVTFMPMGVGAS